MGNWTEERLRRVHLDMHLPEWHPQVLSKYDPSQIVGELRRARANVLLLWCKDHYGLSFYPTKVGKANSLLKGRDLVGEITEECGKSDIAVVAYYSLGVDGRICDEHPDWVTRTPDGEPVVRLGGVLDWGWPCINSPYREYALQQIAEITSWYDISGFFLDMLYYRVPACHCGYCKRLFRDQTDLEMPATFDARSAQWRLWQDFRCQSWERFFDEARRAIKSIKPEVRISHNYHAVRLWGPASSWVAGTRWQVGRYADYFLSETGPAHMYTGLVCRMMRASDETKTFEATLLRGVPNIDYGFRPLEELVGQAMIILSHGGAVGVNDPPAPQGYLERVVYDRVGQLFQRVERVEEYARGLRPARYAALLYSQRNKEACADDDILRYVAEFVGAYKLLIEAHVPFDIVMEEQLTPETLAQYSLLVLPNSAIMGADTARAIDDAYQKGLGVVSSYETSLYDPELNRRPSFALECIGGDLVGDVPYTYTFVEFEEAVHPVLCGVLTGLPIDVRDRTLEVAPRSDGLGNIVYPMAEYTPTRHISFFGYPPPGDRSRYPAIVLNESAGRSVYFPSRVFSSYAQQNLPELRRLVHNAFLHAGGRPPFVVDGPKSLEVTFGWQARRERWVAHLINLPSEIGKHCTLRGTTTNVEGRQIVDEVIPLHDLKIQVRKDLFAAPPIARSLELGVLGVQEEDGAWVVVLPRLEIHDVVTVARG